MKLLALLLPLAACLAWAGDRSSDSSRDILVTFGNTGAAQSSVAVAPYKFRKRYPISARARSDARAVAKEYGLQRIDDWPIKSLAVYCFVFRVPDGDSRDEIIARLRQDRRVESVQLLNEFETGLSPAAAYDDTYANLQYGLEQLDIASAHSYTRGRGVRIAIIDSNVDRQHEDLRGQIDDLHDFVESGRSIDREHGTAVVSVIGAIANNARGIVGVAPEALIDVYVACWLDEQARKSVCDSFSLAKALDAVVEDAPQVLNMSLIGPADELLGRLLDRLSGQGTVIVAAAGTAQDNFPASHPAVIGARANGEARQGTANDGEIYAPGRQIMVALPRGGYDFRSGDSIAAAHVSGVVALVLAAEPRLDAAAVQSVLLRSQLRQAASPVSVDACRAMQLMDATKVCSTRGGARLVSELKPDTQYDTR